MRAADSLGREKPKEEAEVYQHYFYHSINWLIFGTLPYMCIRTATFSVFSDSVKSCDAGSRIQPLSRSLTDVCQKKGGLSCQVMFHLHNGNGSNKTVIALQRAPQQNRSWCIPAQECSDSLLQAVNSVYINTHKVIMKPVHFRKAQLHCSLFEACKCDFKQNTDRCLVPSPMWEVCSCLWKIQRLTAGGHRCNLNSSMHNYSSSLQITAFH